MLCLFNTHCECLSSLTATLRRYSALSFAPTACAFKDMLPRGNSLFWTVVNEYNFMSLDRSFSSDCQLHKGGTTDDKPQDWRPVVLLNCTNQLVMHILNARLRGIVEKAGILEPGQSGGRQGRSTDINLAKLEWVTQEAVAQGKRVYRVD